METIVLRKDKRAYTVLNRDVRMEVRWNNEMGGMPSVVRGSGFDPPPEILAHKRRTYQRHGAVSHVRLHSQPVLLVPLQELFPPSARTVVQDGSAQVITRSCSSASSRDSGATITELSVLLSVQEKTAQYSHVR